MTELDEQIAAYAERCVRPVIEALATGLGLQAEGRHATLDFLSRIALRAGLIPSFARWQETETKKAQNEALLMKALYTGGALAEATHAGEAARTETAPAQDAPARGLPVDEQTWAHFLDDVGRKNLSTEVYANVAELLKGFKVEGKYLSEKLTNIRSDGLRARVLEIAKAKGWV